MERERALFERVRKNSTVEEEVENEVEEEDESGVSITEEEKKKGVGSSGGRRGSSGGSGGVSPPSCQAERCGADLTDSKRDDGRHKVGEGHSKGPAVVVAGLTQRFCQQCSRFVHSIPSYLKHFLFKSEFCIVFTF